MMNIDVARHLRRLRIDVRCICNCQEASDLCGHAARFCRFAT